MRNSRTRRRRLLIATCCCLAFQAAAWSDEAPLEKAAAPPNDRLYTQTIGDIRVTTAVPSAEETRDIFAFGLYRRDVQPVWVRVENLGDDILWFLPAGIDDEYFSPTEAAFRRLGTGSLRDWVLNRDYLERQMAFLILPHDERAGYVFTPLDQGTKSYNIDVLSLHERARMSFSIPIPGLRIDHREVDWQALYPPEEIHEVDRDGLVAGLEALPCCVTGSGGQTDGDPLNIVLVGARDDLYYAFMRAGWDETETIYGSSLWKTMVSAVAGSEYRYSPVSALYVFGRAQDVALQKARSSINQRNHLRLWLTPMRYEGKPVWIGQISRDIGVRLTWRTITTHKIDPDVDDAREFLLEDLAYAQSLKAFGYVGGVGEAEFASPRQNLTGDPYFTDGLRIVLFASSQAVDIAEIERLELGRRPSVNLEK